MKNINLIPLVLSLIMMFSCTSQEELIDPEMAVTQFKTEKGAQEENTYLYEREIHYLSTVSKINTLNEEKEAILIAIENGDKSLVEKLEKNQKDQRWLNDFKEYLLKLPDTPVRIPPKGCLEEFNCDPKRDLSTVNGIILEDSFKELRMEIADSKNNSVETKTKTIKNDNGEMVMLFDTKFEGSGYLQITTNTDKFGRITSEIPIFISK